MSFHKYILLRNASQKEIVNYILMVLFIFSSSLVYGQEVEVKLPLLKISDNQRFLMTEKGDPFFWLGDTGWLLFSKLDREEAEKYLQDRSEKGFNVIQAMVIHQLALTNIYGDSALFHGDVSLPKEIKGSSPEISIAYDYWDHVDFIVDLAEEKGLYMALVPVWGSNVKAGKITREQAGKYAAWLAQRYAGKSNIIWLNGGDTRGSDSSAIWNIMGQKIREHAPNHLITFHPFGRTKSSMWFHNAEWLDFNMFQSGHRRYDQDDSELGYGQDNWKYVRDDYNLNPIKPTIDGEPSYEGIPQGLHDPSEPYWTAGDVRRYAWWSVFAGAFGFTYGHNAIMQMHKPGDQNPSYGVREYWDEALDAQGAIQMQYLKKLILSKPFFIRIPDQSLIASGQGEYYNYQVATRGEDYAFIYTYNGREISLAPGENKVINAAWYNPRNGETIKIKKHPNQEIRYYDPPGKIKDGNDWVLVLEF